MSVTGPVLRVAALHYVYGEAGSFGEFAAKMRALSETALDAGAGALLFPEYGSMELVLAAETAWRHPSEQFSSLQRFLPDFHGVFREISEKGRALVVAPTIPVATADGFVNRAHVYFGGEGPFHQDKLVLTNFERASGVLVPGRGQTVFDTPSGPLGVLVCYDVEFPLPARNLAEAGALAALVPSNTDTVTGVNRVRVGAAARALENQLFTVVATTGGAAPWCSMSDANVGGPSIFCPPDCGMPETGVVARLEDADESAWLLAELDMGLLSGLESVAEVSIPAHWGEQPAGSARVVRLR